MSAFKEAVSIIIIDLAYLHTAEVIGEISPAHPETTVVRVRVQAHFLFESRSPAVTAVTPISGPFEVSPWVS